ncbi:MAG TPA: hypothetical protein VGJ35_03860, partial [Burkholderiaceae bacterium]
AIVPGGFRDLSGKSGAKAVLFVSLQSDAQVHSSAKDAKEYRKVFLANFAFFAIFAFTFVASSQSHR